MLGRVDQIQFNSSKWRKECTIYSYLHRKCGKYEEQRNFNPQPVPDTRWKNEYEVYKQPVTREDLLEMDS